MGIPTPEEPAFLAHLQENGRAQPLRDHLLAVSEAASRHAQKLSLGPAGALIGLLHDWGKYSQSFQHYLRKGIPLNQDTETPALKRGDIDHSTRVGSVD